jgi:hypothetical protein
MQYEPLLEVDALSVSHCLQIAHGDSQKRRWLLSGASLEPLHTVALKRGGWGSPLLAARECSEPCCLLLALLLPSSTGAPGVVLYDIYATQILRWTWSLLWWMSKKGGGGREERRQLRTKGDAPTN